MSIAEVRGLVKKYPSFELKQASFTVEKGRITGFIGRNGAGKTTTIKAMLNLVHPTAGRSAITARSWSGTRRRSSSASATPRAP